MSVWSVVLALSALVWGAVVRADRLRVTNGSRGRWIASDRLTTVVTGVVAIGVMIALDPRADGPLPAIVIGVGVAGMISQTMTDLCVHRLPLRVSHLTAAAILVLALLDSVNDAVAVVVGSVSMSAVGLVIARLTRRSLGRGDVHFGLPLGALIGWWTRTIAGADVRTDARTDMLWDVLGNVVIAWALTAVSAGVIVTALLLTRRIDRSSHIPYGPFMVAGTLLALMSA